MCWFGIGTKPNWEVGVSSALFLMEVRYCCWPTPIQNWSVWLALVLAAMALWVDHRKQKNFRYFLGGLVVVWVFEVFRMIYKNAPGTTLPPPWSNEPNGSTTFVVCICAQAMHRSRPIHRATNVVATRMIFSHSFV